MQGVRAATAAIAVSTATGALVVAEATASGMGWPFRTALAALLGLGVASLVRLGLCDPLLVATTTQRRARQRAEELLAHRDDLDDLLGRLDAVLDTARDDAEVLDAAARAIDRMLPERETVLLLSAVRTGDAAGAQTGGDAASPGYVCPVGPDGLGTPRSLEHPLRCRVERGRPAMTASSCELDACDHARALDLPVSSVCVEVGGPAGTSFVVWSTGAEGDLPTDAELAALGRLAASVELRLLRLRVRPATEAHHDEPGATDLLTGLPDRRVLLQRARHLVEALTPFSVAVCNVDGMANYNAQHGRHLGDQAIATLADVLSDTLRPSDLVCRAEDDTFVALLPRCGTEQAASALERVRESLVLALAEEGTPRFTCSTGVAASDEADGIEELLDEADLAMSMAKYEGGNRVRVAAPQDATKAGP